MKTIFTLVAALLIVSASNAQIITQFNWDNASLSTMQSVIGPNAISISSNAVISVNGANGTNGLNAGPSRVDINMVLPGSYYTVNALDISVDFKREETQASFFSLGKFDFGMNGGSLYFNLPLDTSSSPGYKVISKTGLYTLPTDDAFHTYRFLYNNSTGVATIYVDGNATYTYSGVINTNMNWTTAANATVGNMMDGTATNVAILDNLIIKNSSSITILPLELLSFDAKAAGTAANLTWTTTQEMNEKEFVIERSADGTDYEALGAIAAKGGYTITNNYQFTDKNPLAGKNYYRLRIVDMDANRTYSKVEYVSFAGSTTVSVSCFPNPAIDYVNVGIGNGQQGNFTYNVYTIDGKKIQAGTMNFTNGGTNQLNVRNAPMGILLLELQNNQDHSTTTVKIMKQ